MAIERNLGSQINWRNDLGELFYLHFRKANPNMGHISHEKLFKSFRCPGMRHGDIPEPTNRARGSKPSIGRNHLFHGICSMHSQVTGKLMGILSDKFYWIYKTGPCTSQTIYVPSILHIKKWGDKMADETQCQDRKVFKEHKHLYTHILIISISPFWNVVFAIQHGKNERMINKILPILKKKIHWCVFITQVTQQRKHGKQSVTMKIQTPP